MKKNISVSRGSTVFVLKSFGIVFPIENRTEETSAHWRLCLFARNTMRICVTSLYTMRSANAQQKNNEKVTLAGVDYGVYIYIYIYI